MRLNEKPNLSTDLTEVLESQNKYSNKGFSNAMEAINVLDDTVVRVINQLQDEITRLQYSNIRDEKLLRSLTEQLYKIRSDYSVLPHKLRYDVQTLSKMNFTITVFGRTMAGKSTLMEILTHGDGKTIGNGSQRTTRDVRKYRYRRLQIVDVPGVAAFEGKEDEDKAFEAAKQSDLIFFLMKDEDVQPAVAECLSRIKALGKPIVCLINVKADIGNTSITPGKMKLFRRDLQKKMRPEHLDGIKQQLFEFGQSYGQNWHDIRFAYVHLKAAFLSQQEKYKEYSEELYDLSRFSYIDCVITEEITNNGGFYKLKAYTEVIAVPLVDSVETLFEQSAQNSQQGSIMVSKKKALSNWIKDFTDNSETMINTFTTSVRSDLKKEIALFAEENYANKNAAEKWNLIIKEKNIEKRAEKLLDELAGECENELREISREIDFDIKFSYKLNTERSLNMHKIWNGRRIWNWGTSLCSGGLTIAGLFLGTPFIIAGVGVGLLGGLGSLLFKGYEEKANKARKELERKLTENVNDRIDNLTKKMKGILYNELLKNHMNPMEQSMNNVISSLFKLSDVQYGFACKLNQKLKDINKLVVIDALEFIGKEDNNSLIIDIARLPGSAVILVLNDGDHFPNETKQKLKYILKEQIWFAFKKDDVKLFISQVLGKACKRTDISIETIKEKPRIAHIPSLDASDPYTRNRVRLAQQLTNLLIMK